MPKQMNYDERDLNIILNSHNLDDEAQGYFFASELESVKSKVYEKRYPELTAKKIMPISTDAGAGAEHISYLMIDSVGMAIIVANYANDVPLVAMTGSKTSIPVVTLAQAYGYSIQDIAAAQMANKPLQTHLASAARRAIEAKANRLAYFGDKKFGVSGLLNHPNVPQFILPADGAGGLTTFASKTAEQCIRDLDDFIGAMDTATNGVEIPDTLILSTNARRALNRKRVPDTQFTVLNWWLENNKYITRVETASEFNGAGTGGTDIMLAYKYSEEKFSLEIPVPFTQLPVQARGLAFITPCYERFGGVLIRYPMSIIKTEGV